MKLIYLQRWSKSEQQFPEVNSSTAWWRWSRPGNLALDQPVERRSQKLQAAQSSQALLDMAPGRMGPGGLDGLERKEDIQQDCAGMLVVLLQASLISQMNCRLLEADWKTGWDPFFCLLDFDCNFLCLVICSNVCNNTVLWFSLLCPDESSQQTGAEL